MELNSFVKQITGFSDWSHADKIRLFAWHLHAHRQMSRFTGTDIRGCFKELEVAGPTGIGPFLTDMQNRKPPVILRDTGGFYLERAVREQFDSKYGQRAITVQVHQALRELAAKLPDVAERAYFEEAMICFTHRAFRASAVMTWNLAYDHLCTHILTKRIADFNTAYATRFPKEKFEAHSREDFHDVQESKVLDVCRTAGITVKNVHGVLFEKLNTRNRIAHASGQTFEQPQAEAYILDLVNNAVLVL